MLVDPGSHEWRGYPSLRNLLGDRPLPDHLTTWSSVDGDPLDDPGRVYKIASLVEANLKAVVSELPADAIAEVAEELRRLSGQLRATAGHLGQLADQCEAQCHAIQERTRWVYGVLEGWDDSTAVFLPEALAHELAALHGALGAKTWEVFRAKCPAGRYREVMDLLDYDEEDPAGEVPGDGISTVLIDLLGDGDWPEWVQQEMLAWLPRDLIIAHGRIQDSVHNGYFAEIRGDEAEAVTAKLTALGLKMRRDDALCSLACGQVTG